ncbi:MAG: hypothetical protein DMG13_25800 [Acidobacteria bacterium]|nr:MAG: hypothetical protein DMG13_25800 [Acidobacteriota bacterium]
MKKRFVRFSVLALLVTTIFFPSSLQSRGDDYKLLIIEGRHAGLCVSASSRPAHEAHGDNFLQDPEDLNSFLVCASH